MFKLHPCPVQTTFVIAVYVFISVLTAVCNVTKIFIDTFVVYLPAAFYPPVQGTPVFPSPTAGPPSSEHGFLPPAPDAHVIHHTHLHIPDGPVITRIHSCPRLHVCPRCGTTGPTVVRRESGCCAYLACFSMCWLFCPLFWLPFCLDCDRDLVHRCGKCRTEIARIKPC